MIKTFRNVESRNKYIRREIDKRTMQSIADEVGVSRQRVQQILERQFAFRISNTIRNKRTEKRDKEIVKLYSKGARIIDLEHQFHLCSSAINSVLHKYNVPRHPRKNAWWRKPLELKKLAKEITANGLVVTARRHGLSPTLTAATLKESGFTYIKSPKNRRRRIVIAPKGL